MFKKLQFINPTMLFAQAEDEYVTTEPTITHAVVIRPQRYPPMQTLSYQGAKHLLRLIIANCPAHVALEAIDWVDAFAQTGHIVVMRDYGLTFVPDTTHPVYTAHPLLTAPTRS